MAIEYFENENTYIGNRDVYFEKGNPVDPDKWEMFKRIPEEASFGDVEVTIDSINECFSRVKDSWTGITLKTSMDQFRVFCESNDLVFRERTETPSVIIRHKRFLP